MTDDKMEQEQDLELEAMARVYAALKPLESEAQVRVLDYVERRLALKRGSPPSQATTTTQQPAAATQEPTSVTEPEPEDTLDVGADGLDGVSPLAQKWMKRNGLTPAQMSELYSLGVDEIDLVAQSVPGDTTKDKLRSVLLLQGVAALLNGGTARITHDRLKQASVDYNADAGTNFAKHMKSFASEVSGSKEAGYTLTTKGLNSAKELIVKMTTSADS
ncbi:MAG: hypothetical protein R2712_03575 [Vicinamibacterales bacterium]